MSGSEIQQFLAFAESLADESGETLRAATARRPEVEVKPDRSFVTALDGKIERRLRELIADRFPAHGVLGEEEAPRDLTAEYVWVLDPIDGTAPFIAGVPVFGTLIALMRAGRPIIGVMDHPVTRDRWVGVAGQATRHNGQICKTRRAPDLASSILSASNPDFFAERERPALDALRAATAWRIYGACCMAYGLLASGRTDVAIDTRLKIYDYAPFIPIIEGAGGRITDWQGGALALDSGPQILAAGSADRHGEALAAVRKALDGQ